MLDISNITNRSTLQLQICTTEYKRYDFSN